MKPFFLTPRAAALAAALCLASGGALAQQPAPAAPGPRVERARAPQVPPPAPAAAEAPVASFAPAAPVANLVGSPGNAPRVSRMGWS